MSEKSSKKSRRKYDTAFKSDVLKMVESGRSIPEIAQSLGISETLIYRWRIQSQTDLSSSVSSQVANDKTEEIVRLRALLHRTEQERDILKKALGIFSRGI